MSMGSDRVRAWLQRAPKGSTQIELRLVQIGIVEVVSSWAIEELAHGDGATVICDAAQAHCDALEAAARYTAHFVTADGRTVGTTVLKCRPEGGETKFGGEGVEDATIAGAMGQLLRHQEVMARMYIGAQSGVLANMQQILTLQSETIRAQNDQMKTLVARARAAERSQTEETAADVEALARAEAITKVGDAVAQYVVPIIATRMNGAAPHTG